MNTEQSQTINSMTHRQLMRFAKTIGLKGDFMKGDGDMSATEYLRHRVNCAVPGFPDDIFAARLAEAFPQGIFTRHNHQGVQNASKTYSGRNTADTATANKAEIKVVQPVQDSSDEDIASQIAALLAKRKAAPSGISEERVLELIKAYAPETPVFRVEVTRPNVPTVKTDDKPRHAAFKEILGWVAAKRNVLLVGPAGCGKTHLCEQVAESLGMRFGFTGAVPSEYKLLGFMNATGHLVRTVYREFYENGGLFLWDEMDASGAGAMLSFNAGLANGHQDFPDTIVPRHGDFCAIASANTYGNGADRQYVGRNQMDAASLDRFVVVPMDYDETLERTLFGDNEWTNYVQKTRKAIRTFNGAIRHVVSMRAIQDGAAGLAAGQDRQTVERAVLWKHLPIADINKIKGAM